MRLSSDSRRVRGRAAVCSYSVTDGQTTIDRRQSAPPARSTDYRRSLPSQTGADPEVFDGGMEPQTAWRCAKNRATWSHIANTATLRQDARC